MNSKITEVSQTALLVAGCRYLESKRKNPLFHDDLAHLFLASNNTELFKTYEKSDQFQLFYNSVVVRTLVLDKMIRKAIKKHKIKQIINLGAGLDNRPYRMNLPKSIIWWEFDHKTIIKNKERILKNNSPTCTLIRRGLNLNDLQKLEYILTKRISPKKKTLILSEGFLIYQDPQTVSKYLSLFSKRDFCSHWITDIGTRKIENSRNTNNQSIYSQLLDYMKFFSSPKDKIYSDHNWKVTKSKDLAIEAIKYNRPLVNILKNDKRDNLLLEIQSLEWAQMHYFLCLENENSTRI